MAAAALAPACSPPSAAVAARKSFAGAQVSAAPRRMHCRSHKVVRASAEKKQVELPAVVTATVGAALASPLAAQAAVTPSLKNLINSVVAGGVVLGLIVAAVTAVSNFDPVARRNK